MGSNDLFPEVEEPQAFRQKDLDQETLRRNVSNVLDTLSKNCYGNSQPAKLIAVTKTVSTQVIQMLETMDLLDIAESRAQALVEKLPKIAPSFRIHWIGRLQTNKVKYIIDHVCLIHTLDREDLAREVDKRAGMAGRVMPALVQVNVAGESQKAGLAIAQVEPFLRRMKDYPHISVRGLMAMMPLDAQEKQLAEWFKQMRTLFDRLAQEGIAGIRMDELSMGMSNDYAIAAREGATMVRVGTALFKP
ncbi:MAG: YggS family pyridoxal phosphate-dependent enzyme [Clostridiales bacterium]|nr:YggS family pyridoxal phosphate-dependent enzyme [Clostridiales bacterium]